MSESALDEPKEEGEMQTKNNKASEVLKITTGWFKNSDYSVNERSHNLPIIHKVPGNLCKGVLGNFELFDSCYQGFVWMMYVEIKTQRGEH